ncbi:hypothetical protein DFJ58DRAFT_733835 [Suillus subalutaceus]|uniref:uncharacterized protein n=1 Tax=Suillus subalutaceus TaxID=48586 RepID=UPI001B876CA9|nr:uncharacterized protein DFJ58DRAFT_733835 [Suillus subalutaceus]KAG1838462.1 hypothetical protein DFJ58DRAFT_733835 [Suillus subalutaceus]
MQAPVPSLKLIDLNYHWNKAGEMAKDKYWEPELYHCGAYERSLDCFPVLRSHSYIIYIPASSKPIFRFLQHAMYALWYMSLSGRFNEYTRSNFFRGSVYLHLLREAFFDEVREKFYGSSDHSQGQGAPTCNKMTRQWFSSVLFSWAQATYHNRRISPPDSNWLPPKPKNGQTVSTIFDWASWSMSPEIDPVIRSLYGSLPDETSESMDWLTMDQEATLSGNARAPMVETDVKSWRKCLRIALELLEANIQKAQAEAATNGTAQAAAETEFPTPMDLDTQPPIPGSSKRPASPAVADVRKSKRAKTSKSIPEGESDRRPLGPISSQDKGKGKGKGKGQGKGKGKGKEKEKGKAVESAGPSGSGPQFSFPDALGSGPGPSSSGGNVATSVLGEVTASSTIYWNDMLTSATTDGWTQEEQVFEVERFEKQGDQSWDAFCSRVPARPP